MGAVGRALSTRGTREPDLGVVWCGILDLVASLYPGYHDPAGFGSVIVVTLYGLVDGAVRGAVIGWLYNIVATGGSRAAA